MTRRIRGPRQAGFTLIELLVVIAIIGVLMGLLLVAIQYGRDAAKRTSTTAEIAQISNAIGLFKTKTGATHIPAFGGGANGAFRLCTNYTDASGNWLPWPEVIYLKSIFPNMSPADNGLRLNGNPVPNNSPQALDPNQTLVFFLNGSVFTGFQGFSNNKQQPFTPPLSAGEQRLGPFLDLPSNRFTADGRLLDPYGSPYAYFSFDPTINTYPSVSWSGVSPYKDVGGKFLQPRGFQIISAGKNQVFGPGGTWVPNQGPYTVTGPGGDDVANFSAGPLSKVE
jgi:prepilin-type N-terminal cleavage/methylation domain-containing protein